MLLARRFFDASEPLDEDCFEVAARAFGGSVFFAAASRLRLAEAKDGEILDTWQALLDFCQIRIGRRPVEEFHMLYLNKKNRLIKHELRAVGTIDHTPVYVREVVKRMQEKDWSEYL